MRVTVAERRAVLRDTRFCASAFTQNFGHRRFFDAVGGEDQAEVAVK